MKIKGRRQSKNVEIRTDRNAKQGRRLPANTTVVTAPALGNKIGVKSMKRAMYKRGRNP